MFNAYGPSEATIWVTWRTAVGGTAGQHRRPDPGRPRAGARRLAEPGTRPGWWASCIWPGPALAHGYVGRVELTAERFVANPFGPRRTGRADVSHRRPGALDPGRHARLSGPRRHPDQTAWPANRTGRDRERIAGLPAGQPGRCRSASRHRRRPAGRLHHSRTRHGRESRHRPGRGNRRRVATHLRRALRRAARGIRVRDGFPRLEQQLHR